MSVAYCEPCAPEIPWYMAHSLSCASPSILSIPSWPCPQYWLCAMRSASQQTTQPCAPEIPWYMAHTLSCAYPSILSIPSIPSWPCPQYRLCTMCLASQQTTQPCAIKIQKHMALTAPCDPPPYTSVHIRTYPYCLARSIVTALSPHIKGKDALGIAGAGGKDGELDGKCFTGNRDPAQTLIIVIHTDLFPGTVRSLHFQTELPHQC